jgi:uncharacterized protein YybS (DUF2232 family)
MRGRFQAITVSAVCAALCLLFPPLSYISGAVIGLVTLRNGVLEGAYVIGGSVLLAGVFTAVMVSSPYPVVVFAVVTWIPVWLLAVVLRSGQSQGLAVTAAGVVGAFGVIALNLLLDSPAAWWRELLDQAIFQTVKQSQLDVDTQTLDRLAGVLDDVAPLMTGLVAAGTVFGLFLTLMLARWWHALLDNPGGFGKEFRALRVDRRVAVVAIIITALALFTEGTVRSVCGELLWLVGVVYIFQCLAVIHSVVVSRGAAVGWLVALYVLLAVFPPQVLVLLAIGGFIDAWVDLRHRLGAGLAQSK